MLNQVAEHVAAQHPVRTASGSGVDWDVALAAYDAVRPQHYPVFPLSSVEVDQPAHV